MVLFSNRLVKKTASKVYNYHNLGVGIFPEGEEKTPYGAGERYNFDRMHMMVSAFDFTHKTLLDIGCNSGWFCFQAKLLGAKKVVGIDYAESGTMGSAIYYAKVLEKKFRLGMKFYNRDLGKVDFAALRQKEGVQKFDVTLLLSVLHHIKEKKALVDELYMQTREVLFYEDHEFWNELYDEEGKPLELKGEGFRFGWNEDLSWMRKMGSLEKYEEKILHHYKNSWREDVFQFDRFKEVRFLGFSEKRRPMLGLFI